jgi:hypothetical protein
MAPRPAKVSKSTAPPPEWPPDGVLCEVTELLLLELLLLEVLLLELLLALELLLLELVLLLLLELPLLELDCANWAVTDSDDSMTTVQLDAEPLQAPPQALSASPLAALAVSVICVRAGNWAPQETAGQLMPPGPVTLPSPDTLIVTGLAKSAATGAYWATVRLQGLAWPAQGPNHCVNEAPGPAVASNWTVEPSVYL